MIRPSWKWLKKQLRAKKRRTSRRRLVTERLESRAMLAADTLALITGTVFADQTDNGLTGGDALLSAVAVDLFRDGGDLTFNSGGGDDVAVGSTTTDGSGVYTFTDLGAGTYFIRQTAPGGFIQKAGEDVVTVSINSSQAIFKSPPRNHEITHFAEALYCAKPDFPIPSIGKPYFHTVTRTNLRQTSLQTLRRISGRRVNSSCEEANF